MLRFEKVVLCSQKQLKCMVPISLTVSTVLIIHALSEGSAEEHQMPNNSKTITSFVYMQSNVKMWTEDSALQSIYQLFCSVIGMRND